jgi:putative transposase
MLSLRGQLETLCLHTPLLRSPPRHSMAVGRARLGHCEGAERGDLTGPNPTDRAKCGTKRHVLTDGRGVPLSVVLSGANRRDKWLLAATLDAVVLKRGRGVRRTRHCCLDKGYAFRDCDAAVRAASPHTFGRRARRRWWAACTGSRGGGWSNARTAGTIAFAVC